VETHADVDRQPKASVQLLRVLLHPLLHPEGGVARADGVILVGDRRAEEGHDAVAHDLVHGALVVMAGLDHALEHGGAQPADRRRQRRRTLDAELRGGRALVLAPDALHSGQRYSVTRRLTTMAGRRRVEAARRRRSAWPIRSPRRVCTISASPSATSIGP